MGIYNILLILSGFSSFIMFHFGTSFLLYFSDYRSQVHSPSHDLQPLTVTATTPADSVPAATGTGGVVGELGGGVSSSTSTAVPLVDKDYASFETHATLQTSYNYLDPNFFPAS